VFNASGVGGTRNPSASVALSQLLGFTVSLIKHQAWLKVWPGLADRAAASMLCCFAFSLKQSQESCGQVALQHARKNPPRLLAKTVQTSSAVEAFLTARVRQSGSLCETHAKSNIFLEAGFFEGPKIGVDVLPAP